MVMKAPSLHEIANLIRDYPSLVFSQYGYNAIVQAMMRLIKEGKERNFDFSFIYAVIECYRQREMRNFGHAIMDEARRSGDITIADWTMTILQLYVEQLILRTDGACLQADTIVQPYHSFQRGAHTIQDVWEYLGWIYLILPYDNPDHILFHKASPYLYERDRLYGFLKVFADIDVPLNHRDRACENMAYIWSVCSKDIYVEPDEVIPSSKLKYPAEFTAKCAESRLDWLHEKMVDSSMVRDLDAELEEDMVDLFIALGNMIRNSFGKENLFFEYVAQISVFYPLEQERIDIIGRYERYFHDYTPIAAVEFMGEIVRQFSLCSNYRDDPTLRMAEQLIHKKAESQIIKLHQLYPDVDPRVVELFYTDLCNAYGRGFSGAAPGCMCTIRPIIYEVWENPAVESDLAYLDLLIALEGSYGDPEDVTKPSSNDDSKSSSSDRDEPNTVTRTSNLHRRADDDQSTMKAGERKIYAAYKKYKAQEEKVDNVLKKGIATIKRALTGDQQAVIIEGKQFSPIGFLKKAIVTIGIFNYSKIAGILFLIVSHVLKKKGNASEKKKLLGELERELVMINEKLEDARGDGNREAKYDLMRTKMAYEEAIKRIKLGVGAEGRGTAISKDSQERLRQSANRSGYNG